MRILIIEDDQDVASFIVAGLKAEFFVVDHSDDGEKGSFLARTNDYDIIILDYNLPKMNGLEICQEIRNEGKMVPIIMLTVQSELGDKKELFNAGVDDYLTKPFLFEELLLRIRALLRRPTGLQDEQLTFENLSLNTVTHKVIRENEEIYLTRKEFMLLEYLMRNQGKVMSRSLIMEHVWDINADPFSNTIESHILKLRKKINGKNKKPLIFTIPNRGYKLDNRR
ncbi:MAG: response regulator transcription factor [Planctomycetes bacterium]|jgi:two-component system OmpR family response regulator|nr:response regulator transcription factor [Planctomycetota bacterium]